LIELADTTWTQTSWLSCTDCLDPVAAPLQNTLYELIVADTNGCQAIATSLVRVENKENIFIPNGFTPNNDGANDLFMIYGGVGVTRVKTFVIFDRWGEQVFSRTNFQPNNPEGGWDGTLDGKPLRPAVFVYYAEIEFDNGRIVIFKGDVTLISSVK
jgi:gliding motility-associated-like protein